MGEDLISVASVSHETIGSETYGIINLILTYLSSADPVAQQLFMPCLTLCIMGIAYLFYRFQVKRRIEMQKEPGAGSLVPSEFIIQLITESAEQSARLSASIESQSRDTQEINACIVKLSTAIDEMRVTLSQRGLCPYRDRSAELNKPPASG